MPGSSLWLVPPEDSELYETLHALILHAIPSLYQDAAATSSSDVPAPPAFTPHVTLTADTVLVADGTAAADPQAWLDHLAIPVLAPAAPLEVTLRDCDAGRMFFRKLTLLCERTAPLADLAAHCRAARRGGGGDEGPPAGETVADAAAWIAENYTPHLSLMYSDLPQETVAARLPDATKVVRAARDRTADVKAAKTRGASIWLVPTYKPIAEWQPIARRELREVEWTWAT